jgi:hypothetical protein
LNCLYFQAYKACSNNSYPRLIWNKLGYICQVATVRKNDLFDVMSFHVIFRDSDKMEFVGVSVLITL